jgi:diaminobutyrate-2-oxoglutarate transaminase
MVRAATTVTPDGSAEHEAATHWYAQKLGLELATAAGAWVTTTDGRTYLDCLTGEGAMTLGHQHPTVVAALKAAIDAGVPWLPGGFPTPIRSEFLGTLLATLPEFRTGGKVQFCSSGSDAIDAAITLSKIATGERGVLCFRGAHHGMGHAARSVTGWTEPKRRVPGLMPDVHFLDFPDPVRDPFGRGGDASAEASADHLADLLGDSDSGLPPIACMLVEVVQGDGGHRPAPDGWLRRLRELTREFGIPLVVDEALTGMGRTGTMWAFQRAGIVPDAVVLAKALGGGLPLAAVVYQAELDQWGPGAYDGTFAGFQLGMVTGTAALRHTVEERLPTHAAAAGERLTAGLRALQADHACLGDVRGRGLMVGVDIVDPARPTEPTGRLSTAEPLAAALQAACLEQGLLVPRGGRDDSLLRFLPPLTVTAEEVDTIVNRVGMALATVKAELAR